MIVDVMCNKQIGSTSISSEAPQKKISLVTYKKEEQFLMIQKNMHLICCQK